MNATEHGLDGLHDEPRPGATRTITDANIEQVITTTLMLESAPENATLLEPLGYLPPAEYEMQFERLAAEPLLLEHSTT